MVVLAIVRRAPPRCYPVLLVAQRFKYLCLQLELCHCVIFEWNNGIDDGSKPQRQVVAGHALGVFVCKGLPPMLCEHGMRCAGGALEGIIMLTCQGVS